jgi:hypothetical protein
MVAISARPAMKKRQAKYSLVTPSASPATFMGPCMGDPERRRRPAWNSANVPMCV